MSIEYQVMSKFLVNSASVFYAKPCILYLNINI